MMSDSSTAPRRRGAGSREARKARRARQPQAPAFITRTLPPYALLNEESLAAIERHADRLLEEIGMEIRGDDVALDLWRNAGATIRDGVRVHVPAGLARALVQR